MNEEFRASMIKLRLSRVHFSCLWLCMVLAAMVFCAMLVLIPYERNRRIARTITSVGGGAELEYFGPTWIPLSIRDKWTRFDRTRLTCFDRISEIHLRDKVIRNDLVLLFGSLSELTVVDLERTTVIDEGLQQFRRLKNLKWLYLDETQITDAALEPLKDLQNLERLYLNQTRVTDRGMTFLKDLKNLQILYLEGTNVGDEGLTQLAGLKSLYCLDLSGTNVTDVGLAPLKRLPSLRVLRIIGPQFSDACLEHLKDLTWLERLSLPHVTDEGRDSIQKPLPKCQIYWPGFLANKR